ncbi:MAG: hypothetical protein ACYTG2_09555 [Planctomycetota bacterium]|jgi:hypothetical protein
MRKLLPAVAVLAVLSLPGCIFAIGDETMQHDQRDRIRSLEKRVSALEKHEQEKCSESCKLCSEE